jgi:hypothetical protein
MLDAVDISNTSRDQTPKLKNLLEMLTSSVSIPRKQPIDVNHNRSKDTEQCSKSNHDQIPNSQAQGRYAAEVRRLTGVLIELGGARVDRTREGRLR